MSESGELPFFNFLPLEDLESDKTAQVNEYLRQLDDSLRWLFEHTPAGGSSDGAAFGNILSTGEPDLLAETLTEDLVINPGAGINITLNPGSPDEVVIENIAPGTFNHLALSNIGDSSHADIDSLLYFLGE